MMRMIDSGGWLTLVYKYRLSSGLKITEFASSSLPLFPGPSASSRHPRFGRRSVGWVGFDWVGYLCHNRMRHVGHLSSRIPRLPPFPWVVQDFKDFSPGYGEFLLIVGRSGKQHLNNLWIPRMQVRQPLRLFDVVCHFGTTRQRGGIPFKRLWLDWGWNGDRIVMIWWCDSHKFGLSYTRSPTICEDGLEGYGHDLRRLDTMLADRSCPIGTQRLPQVILFRCAAVWQQFNRVRV